ncbi:rRNA maturation RNase YbeY [Weeksellaceae bacterium KMM 9713]|uniref:Endoribonuclease YbeY n=1 Tax=Profundicola chukchiensis TaxID=2961959 RepID=A0A9X4MV12_9FLAO|nr:rRNA maturation RNase YbeY [Profundicola chukchiensis]MDG4945411.1 rRNA maturation RNase YbeY [Profundicola chukchiensis]MDG4950491.1 rRNA maturation RNase YbeY [Profundicola chukchiensis]
MVYFFTETEFELQDQDFYRDWIYACIDKEQAKIGNVNVIFCDDEYLLEINRNHLQHDYFTDIITFDYSDESEINGDIFISIDRVSDHAFEYDTTFDKELARVIIHGFLHLLGYNDHTEEEQKIMRQKEDESIDFLYHDSEE